MHDKGRANIQTSIEYQWLMYPYTSLTTNLSTLLSGYSDSFILQDRVVATKWSYNYAAHLQGPQYSVPGT